MRTYCIVLDGSLMYLQMYTYLEELPPPQEWVKRMRVVGGNDFSTFWGLLS